ncbi:uncharacterized protein METZ01_LOCUS115188, partial [marine metagenome]
VFSVSGIVTPLDPLARIKTVSFVDDSPSTVIALNVRLTISLSARLRIAGSTAASVVRNPSMVAMFGSIIPAPLTIPPIVNTPSDVSTETAYSFGETSVVMMASAASRCFSGRNCLTAFRIPELTF